MAAPPSAGSVRASERGRRFLAELFAHHASALAPHALR
jgi:hypothetical protein